MTSDRELLQPYSQNQDADAFTELVRRHSGLVFGVCVRATGNAEDAEDAAQGCFMVLARNAKAVTSSVSGWLQLRALSRAIDVIRKRSTRRRHEEDPMTADQSSSDSSWEEIARHVDRALADLPEELRVPLVLHYLEGRNPTGCLHRPFCHV